MAVRCELKNLACSDNFSGSSKAPVQTLAEAYLEIRIFYVNFLECNLWFLSLS